MAEIEDINNPEEHRSVEHYLRMNEKEKDLEIQKAVIRLQNRIRKILYFMETEMKTKVDAPESDKPEKGL